ncbi:unnamed protein product [Lactuca virosa]|uniref:Uncharacterized protein n=1 Tax=Lactuca virosa TaxID=75947 RepID=A0AAU9P8L3_9ASTR|nr:unnamed protein product [Lactuca virosa]
MAIPEEAIAAAYNFIDQGIQDMRAQQELLEVDLAHILARFHALENNHPLRNHLRILARIIVVRYMNYLLMADSYTLIRIQLSWLVFIRRQMDGLMDVINVSNLLVEQIAGIANGITLGDMDGNHANSVETVNNISNMIHVLAVGLGLDGNAELQVPNNFVEHVMNVLFTP